MAKDPAFLFYPSDWISGTMGMTFEEKGAYLELLMAQFNQGHMTSHMVGRMVGQLWDNIKHKFKQDADGLWYNERLEEEKNKRKQFTDSRKNNLKGTNQHTKKIGHMVGHTTSRMENENKDENINKDNVLKKELEQIYTNLISQQSWLEITARNLRINLPTLEESVNKLAHELKAFITHIGSTGEHRKSESDIKKHFIYYYKKNVK